jgi:hypothetical protein
MARTDAPTLQRIGEQEQIGSTASDLGLLQNTSQGQEGVTKLGVQSVQSNPWLAAAAATANGVGSGYAKYKGWQAPGAPPVDNGSNSTPASAFDYTVGGN